MSDYERLFVRGLPVNFNFGADFAGFVFCFGALSIWMGIQNIELAYGEES